MFVSRFLIQAVTLLGLLPLLGHTAPNVTEATLTPNGLIINGANFGDTNPMLFWDDVQSHIHNPSQIDTAAPSGAFATWGENGTPWNTPMDYKQRVTRSGETSVVYAGSPSKKHIGSPAHRTVAGQEDHLYVSWWYKPSQNPGAETGSNKFIRIWNDPGGHGLRISWTHMHLDCSESVDWGAWNGNVGEWNHHEITVNLVSYSIETRVNGVLTHHHTCVKEAEFSHLPLKVVVLGFDHGESNYQSMATELDDIYIGSNAARVELSNSATWSPSMLKEVLPIQSWRNDRIITGTVNGIVAPTSPMYLYVVDATGEANPNGVLVKCTNLNAGHCQWPTARTPSVANDFDGDGKSDLILQNASGTRVWHMDGGTVLDNQTLWPVSDWKVVGTGDFNGDHKTDLLLRKAANTALGIWLNGTLPGNPRPIWSNPAWHFSGIGDFNGDGNSDVVLRKNDGSATRVLFQNIRAPLIANSSMLNLGLPSLSSANFDIIATGDFDGDGKSDLILQNASRTDTRIWLNTDTPNNVVPLALRADHEITGIADFNGDGKSDMLHHQIGGTHYWISMIDTGAITSSNPISVLSDWSITAIGDFDGDGRSDLIQRRNNRADAIVWFKRSAIETFPLTLAAEWQNTPALIASDLIPPSTPTGLHALAQSQTQVNLSWQASTDNVGVAMYRIYRNNVCIGTSNTLTFSDTHARANTLHLPSTRSRCGREYLYPHNRCALKHTLNSSRRKANRNSIQTNTQVKIGIHPTVLRGGAPDT